MQRFPDSPPRLGQDTPASLALARGECLGLIGPTGSGKSTLLCLLYRAAGRLRVTFIPHD